MIEFLKGIDTWFLVLSVFFLAGYFVWSMKKLLDDFRTSIKELKDFIKELFDDRNDHETRIVKLETRMSVCEACNGNVHAHKRLGDK